jgi:hypothetical protein
MRAIDSPILALTSITVSHQACHLTPAQGVISDFFEKNSRSFRESDGARSITFSSSIQLNDRINPFSRSDGSIFRYSTSTPTADAESNEPKQSTNENDVTSRLDRIKTLLYEE